MIPDALHVPKRWAALVCSLSGCSKPVLPQGMMQSVGLCEPCCFLPLDQRGQPWAYGMVQQQQKCCACVGYHGPSLMECLPRLVVLRRAGFFCTVHLGQWLPSPQVRGVQIAVQQLTGLLKRTGCEPHANPHNTLIKPVGWDVPLNDVERTYVRSMTMEHHGSPRSTPPRTLVDSGSVSLQCKGQLEWTPERSAPVQWCSFLTDLRPLKRP